MRFRNACASLEIRQCSRDSKHAGDRASAEAESRDTAAEQALGPVAIERTDAAEGAALEPPVETPLSSELTVPRGRNT
jgi:hypothetical protein